MTNITDEFLVLIRFSGKMFTASVSPTERYISILTANYTTKHIKGYPERCQVF